MGRVVRFVGPYNATVVDEEEPALGPDEVRLQTLFSGISAGTELSFYRDTNSLRAKHWDKDRRLFVAKSAGSLNTPSLIPPVRVFPSASSYEYPHDGGGYEEVGKVVEVGSDVTDVHQGQVIWGTWGHRGSTVKPAEYVRARVLDPEAQPMLGIFSQITAIALNMILDADIHVGETVAVFGLGVPGQIAAQLARLNGARVVAVDALPRRLEMASRLGADYTISVGDGGRRGTDPRTDRRARGRCVLGGERFLPCAARGDPLGRIQLPRSCCRVFPRGGVRAGARRGIS